ncbi:MAG: sensor histidine kinase [Longimicrobiales bacterium]
MTSSVPSAQEAPDSEEVPGVALEAATRLEAFLRNSVETPLVQGLDANDPEALKAGVERALSAIQGLHFLTDRAVGTRSLHDLRALVSSCVEVCIERSDLTVELVAPDEPVQARVDADGFRDALTFVFHNAELFGQGGPVWVTVAAGNPYARVTVEDSGPGFTAEALSRAYDPFYSTSDSGLGLGLPQARMLVRAMGGEIHLRNGDRGALVELSLPAG